MNKKGTAGRGLIFLLVPILVKVVVLVFVYVLVLVKH